mgnify:CR=1 FL=1
MIERSAADASAEDSETTQTAPWVPVFLERKKKNLVAGPVELSRRWHNRIQVFLSKKPIDSQFGDSIVAGMEFETT